MPKVIGVRFRTSPRVYYFLPLDGEEYIKDDKVVVETQRGVELCSVVMPITDVGDSAVVAPLKTILRKATDAEIAAAIPDAAKRREIISVAKYKVEQRKLDMKIADCEFAIDGSKLILYFTAEQRVDFRELVRDLASTFRTRIDLRQIGARDECKLIGGLGACGMQCCCGRFESDCEHVTIKMAKNQNLALTPNKINGICGRLMCCLGYENKTYEDIARRSPKVGSVVGCPDGRQGTVVSVSTLAEKVRVRIGDENVFEFAEFALADLKYDRAKTFDRFERDDDCAMPTENNVAADNDNREPNRQNDAQRKNKNFKSGERHNGGERNARAQDGDRGFSQKQDDNNAGAKNRKHNHKFKHGKRADNRGDRQDGKPKGTSA